MVPAFICQNGEIVNIQTTQPPCVHFTKSLQTNDVSLTHNSEELNFFHKKHPTNILLIPIARLKVLLRSLQTASTLLVR